MKMFSRKGFTILELMIVIAVIAILVGIALPRFKGMQDEGNIARAKGELRMLQTAVESYAIHNNGTLPAALANLTTAVPQIAPSTLPTDPFGGAAYGYATSGAWFVIYSAGPGATAGTASITALGVASDTNSCIYVTNGSPVDTTP
ncbi:MAG: type II secretion system protein [Candidatus Omnitrophica bacterium]|nr:type II secretion system protein [Candidatus Omnitrophota bacterium]